MLLVGVFCGPYVFDIIHPELLKVSADLRMIALIVILLRAGLELRRDTLKRIGATALVMSCVPAIFEGLLVLYLAPIFFHISYLEAAILGTILAAVSPAVVVPLMLKMMDEKRGTKKGIPTLILGASSVDDVFVIVIFTILLRVHSGDSEKVFLKLLEIPESILLGVLIGGACGYILYRVFQHCNPRTTKMTMIVICISIMLTWMEESLKPHIVISALLSVMTVGFVLLEKDKNIAQKISHKLAKLWILAEVLLFVLVGSKVNISIAWKAGIVGAILIFTGLFFRSIGTWLSLWGADFNTKEKMFCVASYLPKATVQAAIGAIPLEMGMPGGEIILAISVLSIVLTAPLGATIISITGKRWLTYDGILPEKKTEL
tara:strand:+ start:2337 stop:3461 length:1125 start_codon:yes stop_codon:yes gene_type:complete